MGTCVLLDTVEKYYNCTNFYSKGKLGMETQQATAFIFEKGKRVRLVWRKQSYHHIFLILISRRNF